MAYISNGEYWGFYWLSEKYDDNYIANTYDVRDDNVVMIKNGRLEEGQDGDYGLYKEMKAFITSHDMSVEENYRAACEIIDIDSFTQYYATMIYIARISDWPSSNYALWRTRDVSDTSSYSDGKWRWMLFDANSPGMLDDSGFTTHNTLKYVIAEDDVFASMWESPIFKAAFKAEILRVGQEDFNAQKVSQYIDQYAVTMRPILDKSWARFHGKDNTKDVNFYTKMESYRAFFNKRLNIVYSWFA